MDTMSLHKMKLGKHILYQWYILCSQLPRNVAPVYMTAVGMC